MSQNRKRAVVKPRKWKMWVVVDEDGILHGFYFRKNEVEYELNPEDRWMRVEVRELPRHKRKDKR